MGRRGGRHQGQKGARPDTAPWEHERTLAEAEEEAGWEADGKGGTDTTCPCGSHEFLLQAYLHVVDGVVRPKPVDIETLTCPQCGREFEAVEGEPGRYLRGGFLGWVELDED